MSTGWSLCEIAHPKAPVPAGGELEVDRTDADDQRRGPGLAAGFADIATLDGLLVSAEIADRFTVHTGAPTTAS